MKKLIALLFVGVLCIMSSNFERANAQVKLEPKIDTSGKEWWRCVCKSGECKGASWISFRSTCFKADKSDPLCNTEENNKNC